MAMTEIIGGLDPDLPLVDRLRLAPERLTNVGEITEKLMAEAADEIERLREALKDAADTMRDGVSAIVLAQEH